MKSKQKNTILFILFFINLIFVHIASNNYLGGSGQQIQIIKQEEGNLRSSETWGRIYIYNDNWTEGALNGILEGSGEPWDPYRISDLEINAEGLGSCIHIEHCEKYFMIENCILSNSGSVSKDSGIRITGSGNGTIIKNNITENYNGITIKGGSYRTSSNLNVTDNTISYNQESGIHTYFELTDFHIIHNKIFENLNGIFIHSSQGPGEIKRNLVFNHSNYGIYADFCEASPIKIFQNTFLNNSPNAGAEYSYASEWDNGVLGNYWDDYGGSDENGDGIGEDPYVIYWDDMEWEWRNDSYPIVGPGEDDHEPNDDFNSATPLNLNGNGNSIEELTIDPPGDVDFFSIDISEGKTITAKIKNLPANYDLDLYYPNKTLIDKSINTGTIDETVFYENTYVAGQYFIKVYDSAYFTGNYSLEISVEDYSKGPTKDSYEPNDSFDNAVEITMGVGGDKCQNMSIYPAGEEDYYKVNITENKKIDITLKNLPVNYDLYFYNPDRVLLDSSENTGTADDQISYSVASISGFYYIKVNDSENIAGNYTLCISISDDTDGGDGDGGGDDDDTTNPVIEGDDPPPGSTGSGTRDDPYKVRDETFNGNYEGSALTILDIKNYTHYIGCTFTASGSGATDAGVYMKNVTNHRFINCTFVNNWGHGAYLVDCKNVNFTSNILMYNNYKGVHLTNSRRNFFYKNLMANMSQAVYLDNSYANLFEKNTIGNTTDNSIRLELSDHNQFPSNNITFSAKDGFNLFSSVNNSLTKNKIEFCKQNGIYLELSNNNTVENNEILNNTKTGLFLKDCNNSIIRGNVLQNNTEHGIYIDPSYDNVISVNSASNNKFGIVLNSSSNNLLTENIANYNQFYGIYLENSSLNMVRENLVNNNTHYGIFLTNSLNNTLEENSITRNNIDGISFLNSHENRIEGNLIRENDVGICLNCSNKNILVGNTFLANGMSIFELNCTGNDFTNNMDDNANNGLAGLFGILNVDLAFIFNIIAYSVIGAVIGVSALGTVYVYKSRNRLKEKQREIESLKAQKAQTTEEDISVFKEKHFCLVHRGPIEGHNYICPNCGSYYCIRCLEAIMEIENRCWSCEEPLDPTKPIKKVEKEEAEPSEADLIEEEEEAEELEEIDVRKSSDIKDDSKKRKRLKEPKKEQDLKKHKKREAKIKVSMKKDEKQGYIAEPEIIDDDLKEDEISEETTEDQGKSKPNEEKGKLSIITATIRDITNTVAKKIKNLTTKEAKDKDQSQDEDIKE